MNFKSYFYESFMFKKVFNFNNKKEVEVKLTENKDVK